MIYFQLLWNFLKVGLFSFGGAYGSIPLIRDIILSNKWMSEEMFAYFIAVSESTPGPIMVNMATYAGHYQAGILGAVSATVGVVLPSFIIIILIVTLMKNLIKNKYVQSILKGIKPCLIGIILATGIYMTISNIGISAKAISLNRQSIILTAILLIISLGYQKLKNKDFSPILLIIVSAVLGIVVYAV